MPLRRVNQAFVLATSTKVDVSGVKLPAHMDDAYFKAPTDKKAKKPTADGLFAKTVKAEHVVDAKKVADQKAVDATLVAAVKKVPQLKAYLGSSFSLKKGQAPHLLKF